VIEENLSEYHLMTDVAVTYVGMDIHPFQGLLIYDIIY
jgi:hypothetical protein